MDAAYSSLVQTKVLYATSLVLLGAKAKFLRRKQSILDSCFRWNFWNQLTPTHVISVGYTKVFCRQNIFQK